MLPYQDKTLPIEKRIDDLLPRMTLEEKIAQTDMVRGVEYATIPHPAHFCSVDETSDFKWDEVKTAFGSHGIGFVHDVYSVPRVLNNLQRYFVEETRLGIPCLFTGEALHGISWPGACIFPMPLNIGAAFDRRLAKDIGHAIASETRALGIHEILAPNLDVARELRWGRVEETFGEDTYLSSEMAYAIVTGEQGDSLDRNDTVAAEPKHFAVHGIAEGGLNCAPARVGPREVETSYLPVFEAGIKRAGAYNAMACYNSIDGDVVIASPYYMTDILKGRFGLRGYIRADFGAVRRLLEEHHLTQTPEESIERAFNAGLDVSAFDFSNEVFQRGLKSLVESGRVPMARLDDAVRRILRIKYLLGLFEHPYTDENRYQSVVRCEAHRMLSLKAARESCVLLQNTDGLLPLKPSVRSIALIGPGAATQSVGSYASVPYGYPVPSLMEVLREMRPDLALYHEQGCGISEPIADEEAAMDRAVALAGQADLTLLIMGDDKKTSGEGMDRAGITLYGRQHELALRIGALKKPCVLILQIGKPADVSAFTQSFGAILFPSFGGELGAQAIAEILLGTVNPSGKLPISFPRSLGHLPCYYAQLPGTSAERYLEGPYDALFPFGHGLSYTAFAYENLAAEVLSGYNVRVTFDITNTGTCAGDAVAQLYVSDVHSSIVTPMKLLKAFERVPLEAGQRKTVTFNLDETAFRLLDRSMQWTVEPGEFKIMIGDSSRDIRLETSIWFGEE